MALGTVAVPVADTVAILAARLGLPVEQTWADTSETIVLTLRLPRVLTALVVGLGLSVAGVTFQGLLRNPLADPYVLGTASGAALGAAIGVLLPIQIAWLGLGLVNILAFIGALASVTIVYRIAGGGGRSTMTSILLTGYAVGSMLAAGLSLAMYLSGAQLRQIFYYLLGSLNGADWQSLLLGLPIIAIGSVLILTRARSLNGLLLGDDTALHLGVDVRRERVRAAGPGFAGDRRGRGPGRAHRLRGPGHPAHRAAAGRTQRSPGAAALGHLGSRLPGGRRPGRTSRRRAAGGHHHRRHRRAHLRDAAASLSDGLPAVSGQGLRVDIDGLSLRYGTAAVLEDIDLHIGPGERLCLVGPNGAGKSSLLRCLTGVAEPSEGSVRLDQVPLAEIERSAIARTISVVPSQVDLPFSMPRRGRGPAGSHPTREPLHRPE